MDPSKPYSPGFERLWWGVAFAEVLLVGLLVIGFVIGVFGPGGLLEHVFVWFFFLTLGFVLLGVALTLYRNKREGLGNPSPLYPALWLGQSLRRFIRRARAKAK